MGVRLRAEDDRAGRGSVLIVDDEPMVRLVYSKFLEGAGLEVVAVASGREALSLLGTRRFDLVLLDIVMPELTGVDLLELLPSQPLEVRPRILMMSGTDNASTNERCKALGAEDVLVKPISPLVLRQAVQAGFEN